MQDRRMKIATYHRVSTLDQNPTLARDELRGTAARLGGEIVLAIEETGSGARNDRPGLARLMDAARHGNIDTVLVWKLDRFGRSALDVLANLRELEAAGVAFTAITQGITIKPGGDAMSRLLVTMLAAVADFERSLIRERTVLGLRKARASGKRIGRPLVLTPAKVAKVKQLRAAGRSWSQVATAVGCKVGAARLAAAR
jgi:putative DNA-invertase from lambdoid prophage Rac